MPNFIDLSGKTFGRLTVLERTTSDKYNASRWICKCECGNITIIVRQSLQQEKTKSCGCLRKESSKKHGLSKTRLYKIYHAMIQRCHNPRFRHYKDYGGRGITVCEEWKNSFESFYNWSMRNGHEDTLTIDRIDNNKGYYPENCRWTTMKVQANNKRRIMIECPDGIDRNFTQISELYGLSPNIISYRHRFCQKRNITGEAMSRWIFRTYDDIKSIN